MKTLIHPAAAALFLLCAVWLPSCNKDNPDGPNRSNPTEFTLKGCDFDITVLDHERGYVRDSAYVFEGVWKDGAFRFGLEKLDPMTLNILPDGQNQLVLRVASDTPGFEGVNASSSARCINIVPDGSDHTVYHLEWVAEGESTITLWNGEGASRKEVSFKVTSWKEIPLEGFRVRYGNQTYDFAKITQTVRKDIAQMDQQEVEYHAYWTRKEEGTVNKYFLPDYNSDWDKMQPIEIVGPVPLNATPTKFFFDIVTNAYILVPDILPSRIPAVDIYTENIKNYPDFRWFNNKERYISTPPFTWETDHESFKNNYIPVYPSDLRERRIKAFGFTKSGSTRGAIISNIYTSDPYEINPPIDYIEYNIFITK